MKRDAPGLGNERLTVDAALRNGSRAARPRLDAPSADRRERERQAFFELMRRADRGIYVHLPLWVLLSVLCGLTSTSPLFFSANALVFAVSLVGRLALQRSAAVRKRRDTPWVRAVFHALLLGNALQWGLAAAMAQRISNLPDVKWAVMTATIGVTAAGTMGMSISRLVRWAYPSAAMLPVVVGLMLSPTLYNSLLVAIQLFCIRYLFSASASIHDDYWRALDLRWQVEARSRQFEQLSVTDALTQIHNRLYFEHRIVEEWNYAARVGSSLAVLLIDIDHFKRINDTWGHPVGDRCLKAVADALRSGCGRAGDLLARYGGEEFIAVLPNTQRSSALIVAERLRGLVASVEIDHEGQAVPLACSIGVALASPGPGSSHAALIVAADGALYAAKQQGRNRVVAAGPGTAAGSTPG